MKKIVFLLAAVVAAGCISTSAFAGFTLGDEGEHDLMITGYMKTGFMWLENDGDDVDDETTFYVRHAAVILKGHILPYLTYQYQVDFAPGGMRFLSSLYKSSGYTQSDDDTYDWDWRECWSEAKNSSSPSTYDAFINFNPMEDMFQIRVGKMKVPFGRQYNTSATKLQFVKRSVATQAIVPGRDIGMMFHGAINEGIFEYNVGVYNGGADATGLNSDDNFLLVARIAGGTEGTRFGKYDMVDIERSDSLMIHGGVGIYSNTVEHDKNNETDQLAYGAELMLRWMGLSFSTEAMWHNTEVSITANDGTSSSSSDSDALGFYIQFGYLFEAAPIEPAFRYDYIEPDDESDFALTGYTFGVNYYLKNHNAKLLLNYTFYDEDAPDSSDSSSSDDYNNDELVLQAQIWL